MSRSLSLTPIGPRPYETKTQAKMWQTPADSAHEAAGAFGQIPDGMKKAPSVSTRKPVRAEGAPSPKI